MFPEWIIQPLTALLGGGGLVTAIAAWRRDTKKGPIEAQTAQVADAMVISSAATGLVKSLTERQQEFEERIAKKEEIWEGKLKAQDDRIDQLESHVDAWIFWYNDLKVNWFLHRKKDTPPIPPDHV